jgi:hypothetical protein
MVFSQKYPQILRGNVLDEPGLSAALKQSHLDEACFQLVVEKISLSIFEGRAIYPRYYEAGSGESFTDSAGYKKVDEGRLVFQMVGQLNDRIIFPMPVPPAFFPNASDVTVFMDAGGNPWFILVEQGDEQRLYDSEALVSPICD